MDIYVTFSYFKTLKMKSYPGIVSIPLRFMAKYSIPCDRPARGRLHTMDKVVIVRGLALAIRANCTYSLVTVLLRTLQDSQMQQPTKIFDGLGCCCLVGTKSRVQNLSPIDCYNI